VTITCVEGDLLDQPVEVIVNAWNRNVIPWWLVWPHGVSGAIRARAGSAPFRELGRAGSIPLGGAVLTGAGRLPFRGIIHVAGISLLWVASEKSIRGSVRSAMQLVGERGFNSVAFPLIGGQVGGVAQSRSRSWILDELNQLDNGREVGPEVRVVTYRRTGKA
jgi:O-acetyl-ADP-ribose deacetylase (regulator of RNase III)